MKILKIKNLVIICALAIVFFTACQSPGGNQTGSEFVPDMAHSVAYEANVRSGYHLNTFDRTSTETRKNLEKARMPVKGTIPRGSAGSVKSDSKGGIRIPENGNVPYYLSLIHI